MVINSEAGLSMTQPREQLAYDVFRGGFRAGAKVPPHWDDLEPWVRDAILVAYLQGKLDGSTRYPGGQMLDGEITDASLKGAPDAQ
jgi:hypothetical protein